MEGVKYKRNEKYKLNVLCKAEGCPWHIYVASKCSSDKTLCVKRYHDEHNCYRVWKNKQTTVKWLSNTFYDRIQTNPQIPPQSIVDAASKKWSVGVSHMKGYRAKKKQPWSLSSHLLTINNLGDQGSVGERIHRIK